MKVGDMHAGSHHPEWLDGFRFAVKVIRELHTLRRVVQRLGVANANKRDELKTWREASVNHRCERIRYRALVRAFTSFCDEVEMSIGLPGAEVLPSLPIVNMRKALDAARKSLAEPYMELLSRAVRDTEDSEEWE